jgi:hypothetical protein
MPPAPPPPTAPRRKQAAAASSRSKGTASASSKASTTSQRQPSMGKSTNRTSHQVQTDDANNRLFRSAFKAAHKAATTAYAASVKAGKQRGQGFSAKAIATKYDATLSDDNPHRITALALINWQKKQKKPGGSPTLPGPKVSKAKAALIEVMITFSQSSQLEGKTQRPSELMAKMTAAVEETAHAHLVSSEQKRSRLLSSVRKDGRITSGQGESIEERRMEALTEENYKRWFDGWEGFLIKRGSSLATRRWPWVRAGWTG